MANGHQNQDRSGVSEAGPLVSAGWLAARLNDPSLFILDIRSAVDGGGRQAYEQAHVPGAVHSDYVRDGWRTSKGMASGLLPDTAFLSMLFARLGIMPSIYVVIVSAGGSPGDFAAAARVYWTFKVAGHDRVSILDGGQWAWTQQGASVESGQSRSKEAPPYPISFAKDLRTDIAAIEQTLAKHDAVLLDSRALSYFEGTDQSPQAARPGRLPGAVQLDHADAFDSASRKLKPLPELQKLFGAVPPGPVVNYCNTGHQAATNWFVLSELLRRPGVSLYDGSMSEWAEDPARPVATGPSEKR